MRQLWLNYNQRWLYLRRKMDEWLLAVLRKALTTAQPTMTRLAQKIELSKPYRVSIGHPDRVAILLVGTGGTGSFTAHILAQLASWAATSDLDLRLYFIDPDTVEQKNLVRQNFCRAELGQPKAFTLAWRYSAAFGLNIIPVVDCFSARMLEIYKPGHSLNGTLMIVIGAVDNFQARRDIAEAITARLSGQFGYVSPRDRLWWIDAGNERVNGQVLIGNSLEPEPLLSPLGVCTGLPLPHLQEPSLLMRPERLIVDDLSCAELTEMEEQSAMINRIIATWIGVYLYRLLQSRDLDLMATYLNLRTGVVRSTPITTGRVVRPEPASQRVPAITGQRLPEATQPVTTGPAIQPQPPHDQANRTDIDGCPTCGGEIIDGQTNWQGVLIGVRFCAQCEYREEVCPECRLGEVVEEEVEFDGVIVPAVCCTHCDWYAPIPAESQRPAQQPEIVQG